MSPRDWSPVSPRWPSEPNGLCCSLELNCWLCLAWGEWTTISLFNTVKLLRHNLHCKKRYINNGDLTWHAYTHTHTHTLTLRDGGHHRWRWGGHHGRHSDRTGPRGRAGAGGDHHGLFVAGGGERSARHQLRHGRVVVRLGQNVRHEVGAGRRRHDYHLQHRVDSVNHSNIWFSDSL